MKICIQVLLFFYIIIYAKIGLESKSDFTLNVGVYVRLYVRLFWIIMEANDQSIFERLKAEILKKSVDSGNGHWYCCIMGYSTIYSPTDR